MLSKYIETNEKIDKLLLEFYELHINSTINLTAIKDKDEFYIKHYLDSIYYFQKHLTPSGELADIGSGGGFPGIVLGIFYPDLKITLIESIAKKCNFLQNSIDILELSNVKVINDRAENVKGKKYDIITARGVAPVADMLKNTSQMVKNKTKWILYKGEKTPVELEEAKKIINKMGVGVETIRVEEPFTRTYCIISK